MKPKGLIFEPPITKHRTNVAVISQERFAKILRINELHSTPNKMHEKVSNNNTRMRNKAQRSHNSKTNVMPNNFHVVDHVMIRPTSARRSNLRTGWTGPMRITRPKSELVFEMEIWRKS